MDKDLEEIDSADFKTSSNMTVRDILNVESLGNNEYRAKHLWMGKGMRAVYGGQVFGLALMAATKCVMDRDSSFLLQSFHCYFVGPMQANPEVIYAVNRAKDGKNFCSVSVEAVQSGKICFLCLVSFQKPQATKTELNYSSFSMPAVPKPDDSLFISDVLKDGNIDPKEPQLVKSDKWSFLAMDICWLTNREEAHKHLTKKPLHPSWGFWNRGICAYDQSHHQNYHRIALAYTSDLLAAMVMQMFPDVQISLHTSLDHTMWFYTSVDSEKWHFHDCEVEYCYNGMALNTSRIFSEDGQVVAICKQESLIRPKL